MSIPTCTVGCVMARRRSYDPDELPVLTEQLFDGTLNREYFQTRGPAERAYAGTAVILTVRSVFMAEPGNMSNFYLNCSYAEALRFCFYSNASDTPASQYLYYTKQLGLHRTERTTSRLGMQAVLRPPPSMLTTVTRYGYNPAIQTFMQQAYEAGRLIWNFEPPEIAAAHQQQAAHDAIEDILGLYTERFGIEGLALLRGAIDKRLNAQRTRGR